MLTFMAFATSSPCQLIFSIPLLGLGGCKDDPKPGSWHPVETWSPGTSAF